MHRDHVPLQHLGAAPAARLITPTRGGSPSWATHPALACYTCAMKRRLLRLGLEVGVLVAIVFAIGVWRSRHHLRGELPAARLATLDGTPLGLRDLTGKPTLLVVAAPWCGVCKANAQNVRWVAGLVGDRARVVTLISSFTDPASARAFAVEHALPGPVLLDDQGLAARLGVSAFPTYFFLDDAGRIEGSTVGYTTTVGLLARLWW